MCPFCGTRTFLPERSNRVGLMFLAIMKDDAYIYNNNVITCILWCKILGRADALNCAALRLSCIVIITSLHRYNCFLASYKLRYCYHPSHPCQFARRGMWWGRGYLLHLRTWEGAESYRCHQEKKVLRHHKKMLHYQNKRLQKCVSQILFVLLQCHSELCFIFTTR